MFRWGIKNHPAPVAGAGGGGAAVGGEVAVHRVDKIDVHNVVPRPSVYGGGGGGITRDPRGASGRSVAEAAHDINEKAREFIEQRKKWFHRQKTTAEPPPSGA